MNIGNINNNTNTAGKIVQIMQNIQIDAICAIQKFIISDIKIIIIHVKIIFLHTFNNL